ncbi:unnamed protein product [Linum trigynum]|uniref:Integrase catalytic domain-containing protein n=1 Tax=Linum trigynum TaxID=586398 RepID=A0AAV2G2Q5_9ROSI
MSGESVINIDDANTVITLNPASQLPTKLTGDNFPTWRAQLFTLLRGLDLLKFLDGSHPQPAADAPAARRRWYQQDQLILHSILASMAPGVSPYVSAATSSHQAWTILERMFANQSRQRVMNLKEKIGRERQGNRPVSVYLQVQRSTAAELALINAPVSDEDLILHILRGLREEYGHFSAAIRARDTPIAVEDLHDRLVDFEADLAAVRLSSSSAPTTAFSTARGRYASPGQRSSRGSPSPPYGFVDSRRSSSPRTPRVSSPSRSGQSYSSSSSGPSLLGRPQVHCQFCDKAGHTAKECFRIRGRPQVHHTAAGSSSAPGWLIDSAATNHVTPDLGSLSLYTDYNGPDEVLIGDGTGLHITHIGDSSLSTPVMPLSLRDVLCVPAIKRHLLSVAQLCKANPVSVEFFSDSFVVKDLATGAHLLRCLNKGDVYELPAPSSPVRLAMTAAAKPSSVNWHKRLGHPHLKLLSRVLRNHSLPVTSVSPSLSCESCSLHKSHKLPFSISSLSSSRPFDLLYMDVWGPSPIISHDDYSYYLVIVDHFSRYTWLYPLRRKSDVHQVFTTFKAMIENYFHTTVRRVYSDGGGEFQKLSSFFQLHGITHLLTPPHTPQHNGLAERKHRHIVETGLTLLHTAHLPLSFWTYAFRTAAYLINRLPSSSLRGATPYFTLFNEHPNYLKLRVFGCVCYPWLRPYSPHKLAPRSRRCIFLGYSLTQSEYQCFDPDSNRIFASRHVQFEEELLPGLPSPVPSTYSPPAWVDFTKPPISQFVFHSSPSPTLPVPDPTVASSASPTPAAASPSPAPRHLPRAASPVATTSQPSQPPPPAKPANRPVTRSQHGIFCPKKLFLTQLHFLDIEPSSVKQALADPRWQQAMWAEYKALLANQSWTLIPRPLHQHIVGCRWIFRIKRRPDGSIDRFKARLVAKGYTQRPGIDFHDTYSPVLKPVTIRTIFSIALTNRWPVFQYDVNNAFLQGSLQETVYMTQPPGFRDPAHPDYVCCLTRPIYGLRQAPRSWYMELSGFLEDEGFVKSKSDASLFVYHKGSVTLYFLVYVDDLLLTGNHAPSLSQFQARLSARFSLKSLGNVGYFLGIEVLPTADGLLLSQHKFVLDVLARFGMSDARPAPTPLSATAKLALVDGTPPADITLYKQAVGSLQYLLCTRPDIAFAVNKLSQFMHAPTQLHWQHVKRLFRYLLGTSTYGLRLTSAVNPTITAFADSDWAGDPTDRTSTMAYLIYYGNNLISWKSKKQRSVARSSTEAEYRALAHATSEILWIRNLLSELHQPLSSSPTLHCDNLGAVHFSANPIHHSRMKHLALDYLFVRDLVQSKELHVQHIPTSHQLADSLTKPLPITRYQLLRSKIGVVPATILRGRDKASP